MEIDKEEKKIIEFWKKDKTFEKSLKKTKKGKPYIFYDGPPFATGLPHYGHILGSVTKDLFGRFWTMNGRYVRRVWGWDCHGLPVENIAERELKINSKDEIEKIGVKKFNNFCRSKVLGYTEEWKIFIERIARWVDMEKPYKTMDNEYIESVWWAFKQLYEKGFIYEGKKVLMYCPRCSTPLAKAEIAMDNSYKLVKENSLVVKFKLKGENIFALAWTTTPWTLPSNLGLAVNPKLIYAFVKDKKDGTVYLMGKDVISNFYKDTKEYTIIKEVAGKELEGKEYEPLFDYYKGKKNAFKFMRGDFVSSEEGTGIVHTAPYGEDDFELFKKYKVETVQNVDEKGHFTKDVKDFAGEYIHNVNDKIIDFLKRHGKVVLVKRVEHEYPFCYRCDTKLIYMPLPALFVDIQKIKQKLLKFSKKIKWYPEFLRDGRVKYSIETAPDWNITRNRYWASAIPIWVSKDGEKLVIGSIEELKKYAKKMPAKIDLHKDFLDGIILEKNGKEFRRVPEVLDAWFESGAMTFAQFHYPFENKKFFEENFPAQFVAEYIGQVRAWFYYMIVLSAILFDEIPFENVVTTGTILAEDGQKMSKSKKNFIDPMIIMGRYGADSLRFYLLSSPLMNADNLNFSDKGVDETYKKVILLLYNVNNFYGLYKNKEKISKPKSENILDRWIISKLNELIRDAIESFTRYNTISACLEIKKFIDDLSTWYVRRSRDRFNDNDKEAKKTLGWVLQELSKVIAPLMPLAAEMIYHNVADEKDSVHLQDWPKYDKKAINEKITKNMAVTREIISLVLKERDTAKISLKQPLAKLEIYNAEIGKEYLKLIEEEANVKKVEMKKDKEKKLSVRLDTNITPELEAEGYAREIARQIQAFRKELGLKKDDEIKLAVSADKELRGMLEKFKKFIMERTNSREIEFFSENVTTVKERFKKNTEFKIKDKRGRIGIIKK